MLIKKSKELIDKAVLQLNRYQTKQETPIKTSIDHFNDLNLGGIYRQNIITIGARSGVGKSFMAQTIESDFLNKDLNPEADDYVLLRANWEMSVFKILTRSLSKSLKKTYRQILNKPPTESELADYKKACDEERRENVFYLDIPLKADDFEREVGKFLEEHKDKKFILVSIDHIGLTPDGGRGKQIEISMLIEAINRLRQKYLNVSFLILSQLNRDIETRTDIKQQAPLQSDLYNSDTIGQISDCVVILNIPSKLRLDRYLMVDGISKRNGQKVEDKYSHLEEQMMKPDSKFTNLKTVSENNRPYLYYHYVKVRDGLDESVNFRDIFAKEI